MAASSPTGRWARTSSWHRHPGRLHRRGGLGEPIVTGLQLAGTTLILSGALPAALLAIAVDLALGRLETAVRPRGLRSG